MTVNSVFIKPAMAKGHLFIHHPKVIVNHSPGCWFITIVAMDNLSFLVVFPMNTSTFPTPGMAKLHIRSHSC
jgi:hypothetical protein